MQNVPTNNNVSTDKPNNKPDLKPEKQTKNGQKFLIFLVFLICTGAISAAFFFGWKYYKERFRPTPTERIVEERLAFEAEREVDSFMFSEFSDISEPHLWKNTNLISLFDQKIYPILLPENVFSFIYPQVSGERVYYYTTEDKPDNFQSQKLTLWSSDLYGENEKKIVSFTDEFYPKSLFISPDGKYLTYYRIKKAKPEASIWLYDIEQDLGRELTGFSANFYLEWRNGWSVDSSKFYFFERENITLQLKEVKIEGTEIVSSFHKIDFSKLELVGPRDGEFTFFVSPKEDYLFYLKQDKKDNKIKSSSLVRVDTQISKEDELVKLDGDISKVMLSPDGKKLVFRLKPNKSDMQEIYVVDSDGQNLKKLTQAEDKDETLSDLMFSGDSQTLVFVRKIYHQYTKINQINLNDFQEKTLLTYEIKDPKDSSYLRLRGYVRAPKGLKWGEFKEGLAKTLEGTREEVKKEEFADETLRTEIMQYVEKNIDNLAPFLAASGESWDVLRYAFVSSENAYVEYEDSRTLSRVLFHCVKVENNVRCGNIATFEPENLKWKLTSGSDPFSDRVWQYYEKDSEGNWFKSFTSDEITFFPQSGGALVGTQEAVDRGHNLWHRDPLEVTKTEMPDSFEFDPASDTYDLAMVNEEEGRARVTITHFGSKYEVDLEQPVKRGREGIWVMVRMIRVSNE
jgi:hypothetical protein